MEAKLIDFETYRRKALEETPDRLEWWKERVNGQIETIEPENVNVDFCPPNLSDRLTPTRGKR